MPGALGSGTAVLGASAVTAVVSLVDNPADAVSYPRKMGRLSVSYIEQAATPARPPTSRRDFTTDRETYIAGMLDHVLARVVPQTLSASVNVQGWLTRSLRLNDRSADTGCHKPPESLVLFLEAASLALQSAGIPMEGPFAAVRLEQPVPGAGSEAGADDAKRCQLVYVRTKSGPVAALIDIADGADLDGINAIAPSLFDAMLARADAHALRRLEKSSSGRSTAADDTAALWPTSSPSPAALDVVEDIAALQLDELLVDTGVRRPHQKLRLSAIEASVHERIHALGLIRRDQIGKGDSPALAPWMRHSAYQEALRRRILRLIADKGQRPCSRRGFLDVRKLRIQKGVAVQHAANNPDPFAPIASVAVNLGNSVVLATAGLPSSKRAFTRINPYGSAAVHPSGRDLGHTSVTYTSATTTRFGAAGFEANRSELLAAVHTELALAAVMRTQKLPLRLNLGVLCDNGSTFSAGVHAAALAMCTLGCEYRPVAAFDLAGFLPLEVAEKQSQDQLNAGQESDTGSRMYFVLDPSALETSASYLSASFVRNEHGIVSAFMHAPRAGASIADLRAAFQLASEADAGRARLKQHEGAHGKVGDHNASYRDFVSRLRAAADERALEMPDGWARNDSENIDEADLSEGPGETDEAATPAPLPEDSSPQNDSGARIEVVPVSASVMPRLLTPAGQREKKRIETEHSMQLLLMPDDLQVVLWAHSQSDLELAKQQLSKYLDMLAPPLWQRHADQAIDDQKRQRRHG